MTAIRRALSRLTRAAHRGHEPAVHFHRGPHGDPTPCFETRCSTPQLDV